MYAALEFDKLLISGMSFDRSLNCLKKKEVNQLIIEALSTSKNKYSGKQLIIQDIMANKLISGMIIDDDIRTCSGVLVAPKGIEVTFPILKRIKNFSKGVGIHEPIRVMYTETIK